MADVTVVGAGVLGLTCARALRESGLDVRVVARDEPTVSAVAGGLWLPYAVGEDERVARWALDTLDWLAARGQPEREYLHLQRDEPWWLAIMPPDRVRPARAAELPAGAAHGWVCRVPLVPMDAHLAALRADVAIESSHVSDLADFDGVVVNCAGLAARDLVDDPALHAVRGQVVHVRAPAGTPCLCDEDELIYVLPHDHVCVVGGTSEPGDEDLAPRPEQTARILERAATLVPGLRGAPVLDVRVGLRPVRDGGPRVERIGDVVHCHCHGHGGGGLTLSWGCTAEVAGLVGV